MKERLTNLLGELDFFLNNSPIEDDCTDKENEMYSGLAMAIVKKVFGNKGSYFNKIKRWTNDYNEES